MKKLIGLLLYGLLIFGLSAGVGWYLRQPTDDALARQDPDNPSDELSSSRLAPPVSPFGDPPLDESAQDSEAMPVAARPEAMSVEEIVRYGLGLKERDRVIREREEALQRLERQQRMVLADIQGEQQELEGLLIQARDQREAAEKLLREVAARKQELDAASARQEADTAATGSTTQPNTAGQASADLRTRSELLENISPEKAAGIIREWADNGDTEEAARMLVLMEQRNAAKIIEALGDDKLIAELVGNVQALKPAPRTATRR